MAQHIKPGTCPVPSGGTGTVTMWLNTEAERAYQVWSEILCARAAADPSHPDHDPSYRSRVRLDRLDAVLAADTGSVADVLLGYAVLDARHRDLPSPDAWDMVSWDMAVWLREELARLDPPARLVTEQAGTCRHDVPYADECAACGV